MKKIKHFILAVSLFAGSVVFAQAPEKLSYQAVVRNTANNLVTNQAVGMRLSILQSSATGTAVYVETQTPTSNANGLVSIEIGGGTVVSGAMATINWASGSYFIKTETDPTGGTNYTITGTSQLLSTPYALYAKTSGSSTPGPAGAAGQGVPTGGTANQVLAKVNATDYNTQWVTPSGADNLGNHTATTNLAMGGNNITGTNNITATGTATLGGNTYPTTTGTNGQVLTTNGAGALSWGSASGGGGAQLLVRVFANSAQSFVVASSFLLPAIATCMGGINTNVGGAWNPATGIFTAPSAGLYMVSVQSIPLAGTTSIPVPSIDMDNNQALPLLDITGGEGDFFGGVTTQLTNVHPNPYKNRGQLQALVYLTAGQTFSLRMHSHLQTAGATPSQDGTTNMTIVKLN